MAKLKILYHIKKETRNGEEKSYWNRVGRGFLNEKDGSITLYLETLPVGLNEETALNLRDYEPKEERGERKGGFKDKKPRSDDDVPF